MNSRSLSLRAVQREPQLWANCIGLGQGSTPP